MVLEQLGIYIEKMKLGYHLVPLNQLKLDQRLTGKSLDFQLLEELEGKTLRRMHRRKSFWPCIRQQFLRYAVSVMSNSLRPMDHSPPDSCVHGISQAKILEWVAISFSRGSSRPRDQTHIFCVSCIALEFFVTEPPGKLFLRYNTRQFIQIR